jgi:hypothetical protein
MKDNKDFCSARVFKKLKKQFKHAEKAHIIKMMREKIDNEYDDEKYSLDCLLEKFRQNDFTSKWNGVFGPAFVIGIVAGAIAILAIMVSELIPGFFAEVTLATGRVVILVIILVILCSWVLYKIVYDRLSYANNEYILFILPYEKHVITKELREKGFLVDDFDFVAEEKRDV